MRYGLLSDIHGNLAALRAAVDFLERRGVDAYLCPGDVVGYGPQPNECVELVAALDVHCTAGNHDLIATGALGDETVGRLARRTLAWTRDVLEPSARAWLSGLPLYAAVPAAVVAHGSLGDPTAYITTEDQAAEQLALLAREHAPRILVLGHTHHAAAFGSRSGGVMGAVPSALALALAEDELWLLNPGAVGQSRERDVRAHVALLDVEQRTVAFHSLPYDVAATRAELRRHGLPAGAVHLPPASGARTVLRRVAAAARPQRAGRAARRSRRS